VSCADHQRLFAEHRSRLLGIAYRMLGSLADAEDTVQDTWTRWERAELDRVGNIDAYLTRAVANTALNRLRAARVERERYEGPWLPEPVVTEPGPEERAEMDDAVSLAMLVVLETLSPLERAAFVLHDVFGYSHDDVAGIVDRSPAAVRQLVHRAREHVRSRRPRFAGSGAERRRATEAFLTACRSGAVEPLLALLAPDVALWTDGGGKVPAARRPIHGPAAVARFLLGVVDRAPAQLEVTLVDLNGAPGFVATAAGRAVVAGQVETAGGLVSEVRLVANPDKLRLLDTGTRALR